MAFDAEAAIVYAAIFAVRRRLGRPSATVELMIAAIARSQQASVVTRNVADFEACALPSSIHGPGSPTTGERHWNEKVVLLLGKDIRVISIASCSAREIAAHALGRPS